MAIYENIFLNRINTNTLLHTSGGSNTVWTGIDHMVLDLIGIDDGLADVQLNTSAIGEEDTVDFSTNGFLVFSLGDKGIASGSYLVELTAVDGSGNLTQIIHPDREHVVFKIHDTKPIV